MQSDSIASAYRRRALLGLAAVALMLAATSIASAQSTPNDVRLLRNIQPRAEQTLHKLRLSKAAAEDAVVLDQRWMYEWTDERWQHIAQTLYVYQGTDRTEEWQFVWNGFALVNQSRTTYTVESGRMLSELYEQWDPQTSRFFETDRYLYAYLYDLFTGEIVGVATTFETKVLEEWQPVERTTFVKETASLMTGKSEEWAGDTWLPRSRFRLEQSDDHVIQTEEEWFAGDWTPTTRTSFYGYTIDELRETSDAFLAAFMDYAGLLYGAHLFPNYSIDLWDGAGWIPSERKTSLLIIPGSDISFTGSLYEVFDGDQFVAEQRIVTTHRTSDGKPTHAELSTWTGNEFAPTLSEVFEHNNLGDMTRATQQVNFGEGLENSLQFTLYWDHVSVGTEDEEMPGGFALNAAYPNPFNPATSVQYRLASAGRVAVRAYDALGRQVATLFEGNQSAGTHEATFDASGLSSGVYMIRLEAPGFSQVRTVTLLK